MGKVYIILCSDTDREGFSEVIGVTSKESKIEKLIKNDEKLKGVDGTRSYTSTKFNI